MTPLAASIARLAAELCTELLEQNAEEIAFQLPQAEKSKVGVSLSLNIVQLSPDKVCIQTKIRFARKFEGETEGFINLNDPNQPQMALAEAGAEND